MYLYIDLKNDRELTSDAYPCKKVDNAFLEVEGKSITINNDIDDSLIGGNASAEDGGDDACDSNSVTAVDIVHTFKLVPANMEKKDYLDHLKKYIKFLSDKKKAAGVAGDELTAYQKVLQEKFKQIKAGFDKQEFEPYINDDYDQSGMMPLLNYREDGVTPYLTFFLDGMRAEKC